MTSLSAPAQKGFQLIELVVTLAVLGLVALLGVPSLLSGTDDLRLHMAAGEVVGVLRMSRSFASRYDANVAVKFRTDSRGAVTFTVYRDGDGDGLLNRDIDTGTDPQVVPPQGLKFFGRDVRFGFPPGPAPTDPGSPGHLMDRLDDPIRFNQSDLASFGPLGTSTPGSVYLRNGSGHLVVVRVLNRTGKVGVLTYDAKTRTWRD
jgi:prepilin-type N-terminal cleavage/methylation domain-containing protein